MQEKGIAVRIKAQVGAGSEINSTIDVAIQTCRLLDSQSPYPIDRRTNFYDITVDPDDTSLELSFGFEFNGVNVTVTKDSDAGLIYRDWSRALEGCIDKNVGPNPNPVLTDEERQNDALVRAENQRRREERQAQYAAEAKARRDVLEAKLASAPRMQESDPEAWEQAIMANYLDRYGNAVIEYAERWARLMQLEMASGKALEDVARDTSFEADTEGITGFMYGAAVSVLAKCWTHGDQLRRWHNLDTQIGDEGERANETGATLNPALLNVGRSS